MKKTIFIAIVLVFTLGATTTFASNADQKSASENPALTTKPENKLSTEEVNLLTKRVEEIRDMDKSEMTFSEKSELRKESREIKKNVRKNNTVVIGTTTLLLIIIIIILL